MFPHEVGRARSARAGLRRGNFCARVRVTLIVLEVTLHGVLRADEVRGMLARRLPQDPNGGSPRPCATPKGHIHGEWNHGSARRRDVAPVIGGAGASCRLSPCAQQRQIQEGQDASGHTPPEHQRTKRRRSRVACRWPIDAWPALKQRDLCVGDQMQVDMHHVRRVGRSPAVAVGDATFCWPGDMPGRQVASRLALPTSECRVMIVCVTPGLVLVTESVEELVAQLLVQGSVGPQCK